jgi:N-acetylmuramoyl-L-alanine amidase
MIKLGEKQTKLITFYESLTKNWWCCMKNNIIQAFSPNFNERRPPGIPKLIVLHYTGMLSAASALARLCDPASEVSSHYLIDEQGQIYQLVPNTYRSWHAGTSSWQGVIDINSWSIGIELDNPGHEHGYQSFPQPQISTLVNLLRQLCDTYLIPRYAILGHSDIAPQRKQDPGELFPWNHLIMAGLGIMPAPHALRPKPITDLEAQKILQKIGYGGAYQANLYAFQRHFVPQEVTGVLTPTSAELLSRIPYLTFFDSFLYHSLKPDD